MVILHQNTHSASTREGRLLHALFQRPHRLLSTYHVNGGLPEDLIHVCNHKSCEDNQHTQRFDVVTEQRMTAHHNMTCQQAGIATKSTTPNNTTTNIQCAVVSEPVQEELCAKIVATASVSGNTTPAPEKAPGLIATRAVIVSFAEK